MTIAALAVGATEGYVYIRFEYPQAIRTMREAVERATAAGYLGDNVLDSGKAFTLHVREAAGGFSPRPNSGASCAPIAARGGRCPRCRPRRASAPRALQGPSPLPADARPAAKTPARRPGAPLTRGRRPV
jgi:NADH:ubiquinone oxidoreductase subunit F (NADH-binding)